MLTKRQRFVITSVFLILGFSSMFYIDERYRITAIFVNAFLTIFLFYWSLRESIRLDMTLMSLVLPFFFTIGVGLFWFLLPSSILVSAAILLIYAICIYALCLTANIYTVSAIRTIALLRAARVVGFVLTLLSLFLMFDAILSLRVNLLATSALVFAVSIPLFMQVFWSIPLSRTMNRSLFSISIVSALLLGEIAVVLYFWPLTISVGSLFFTVSSYMLIGLGQAKLEGRLFKRTIREFVLLGVLVFVGMFLATRWGS